MASNAGERTEWHQQQVLNFLGTIAEKHLTALRRYGKEYEEILGAIERLIETSAEQIECCICGQLVYENLSCNPNPIRLDGRSCRECEVEIVIPARAKQRTPKKTSS